MYCRGRGGRGESDRKGEIGGGGERRLCVSVSVEMIARCTDHPEHESMFRQANSVTECFMAKLQ